MSDSVGAALRCRPYHSVARRLPRRRRAWALLPPAPSPCCHCPLSLPPAAVIAATTVAVIAGLTRNLQLLQV